MAIRTLLWDVGGVALTNGWDVEARQQMARQFQLDFDACEERHKVVCDAFERGQLSENDYWRQTVLAVAAPGKADLAGLRAFMRAQSQPNEETLALLRGLAKERQWQMGTLNNESLELNLYRIERFALNRIFSVFFSSCWLDARKPDALIYERALQLLQRRPEEVIFTDDRDGNLEYPRLAGWHTIHFENARQLRDELRKLGVSTALAA